uniref:Uncharacterized protein n=1 Tax=Panagrolaimus sp. ES5 TaxID=591445 RepID=A0AC34FYT8_9BILA
MRQNAQIIKEKLLASPFSSKDRFLKYVEFVAKFKEFPEYNLPGAKMSFFYVYNIDVF